MPAISTSAVVVSVRDLGLSTRDVDWMSVLTPLRNNTFFERDDCQVFTTSLIKRGILSGREAALFVTNVATGLPLSSPTDMTVTLEGCEALCGPPTFYIDAGPRFMTWVLPITLLLSNIELSPTDKRRYSTLIEVLGNPAGSIWSLTHKLQTWNRLYYFAEDFVFEQDGIRPRGALHNTARRARYAVLRMANIIQRSWHSKIRRRQFTESKTLKSARKNEETILQQEMKVRVIATVLAGFEELLGAAATEAFFNTIMSELWNEDQHIHWVSAAGELAGGRTDEFFRTLLAVAIYMLQVASAFVKGVGGEPQTPPGGVIASGVFLSYLVPTAVLSNCIGAFTDRRTCLRIISKLVEVTAPDDIHDRPPIPDRDLCEATSWEDYFHQFHFRGGNPTYRPFKISNLNGTWAVFKTVLTAIWSICPVLAGFAGAYPILIYALPTGFSCRHIWLLLIFTLWIASLIFSISLHIMQWGPESRRWQAILAKDFIIGTGALVVIVLSAVGAFNSCSCWGRALWVSKVVIPLITTGFYKEQGQTIFPWIVTPVLVFQLLFCAVVIFANRRGVYVMRWNEEPRRRVWEEEQKEASRKEAVGREAVRRLGVDGEETETAVVDTPGMEPIPLESSQGLAQAGPDEEAEGSLDGTTSMLQEEEEWFDAQPDTHVEEVSDDAAEPPSLPGKKPEVVEQINEVIEHQVSGAEQAKEMGPEPRYDNFAVQRYDHRYYLILWKASKPQRDEEGTG
ncbi:hypothetical protein B0T16DRAFT_454812 [Cercophora newfieldiana]|uniref:Uncharacterized protein n=1 Tax=Cercophora newfieldiana TaxID=92897 RepID=A0AA40CUY9_9PEZI|nr:hypothetical protein B0T16DRAFT_454812 [Cercophora newfieldiana]